jgi:homoserine kinase
MKEDYELISRALKDVIVEPVRSKLIPHFDQLKRLENEEGVLGGGISGSGPSVFMLSRDEKTARELEKAMRSVYQSTGIEFHIHVTTINPRGAEVVKNITA